MIFKLGAYTLSRRDLWSFKERKDIDSILIDSYTAFLNENEAYKGTLSPLRLFVPTIVLVSIFQTL